VQETLPIRAGIHREPDEEAVGPDGKLEFHWEPKALTLGRLPGYDLGQTE